MCEYVCECVSVCAPEITNFNTDETEMNVGPGAIAHLQMSMLNKNRVRESICFIFHLTFHSLLCQRYHKWPRFTFP